MPTLAAGLLIEILRTLRYTRRVPCRTVCNSQGHECHPRMRPQKWCPHRTSQPSMKRITRMHPYRVGARGRVLKPTAAMSVSNTRLLVRVQAYPVRIGEDSIFHQPRFPEDGDPSHGKEENEKGQRYREHLEEEVDKGWGGRHRVDCAFICTAARRPRFEDCGAGESRIAWFVLIGIRKRRRRDLAMGVNVNCWDRIELPSSGR